MKDSIFPFKAIIDIIKVMKFTKILASSVIVLLISSCSYEKYRRVTEEIEIPSQVFKADFNQTWQAVVQVIKKYDIAQQNQEAGFIKTRWIDNTQEINFSDSFSRSDSVKAARFKLVLNVVKGYKEGKEVAKVSVYKRQMVENDFLQGWKEVPSDNIQEKTILYRIRRLIAIDENLKAIDKARQEELIESF